jgi:hypothetical protein
MQAHARARMPNVTVTFLKMPFLLNYQGFQRVVVGNKVTGNEKRPAKFPRAERLVVRDRLGSDRLDVVFFLEFEQVIQCYKTTAGESNFRFDTVDLPVLNPSIDGAQFYSIPSSDLGRADLLFIAHGSVIVCAYAYMSRFISIIFYETGISTARCLTCVPNAIVLTADAPGTRSI